MTCPISTPAKAKKFFLTIFSETVGYEILEFDNKELVVPLQENLTMNFEELLSQNYSVFNNQSWEFNLTTTDYQG